MNIIIVNGNKKVDAKFNQELVSLKRSKGHKISILNLRDYKQLPCTGCLGCWFKTPGQCVYNDETSEITRKIMSSDLVIYISSIKMGFISPLLKVCFDKHVPLSMPYFELVNGEVHHVLRMNNYPRVAFIINGSNNCDEEDFDILKEYFNRFTINYRKRPEFVLRANNRKEIIDAINTC